MAFSGRYTWRDFVSDGIPSSGEHDPDKKEIRDWAAWMEGLILAISSAGGKVYASRAAMNADLTPAANTPALVIGDPVVANNGIYMKVGAAGAGSWTRLGDVPGYQFVRAENTGSGTANAIVATSALPVSSDVLIYLPVATANTASPVTVSFNAGPALTIKTNSGNNVAAGGLVAGMILLGVVSGSTFRLVSDQASASIVAAAEAALAEAQTLVGQAATALQPGDVGSAAYADIGDFATAVQGGYADMFHSIMPHASANVQGVGAPGFDGGNLFLYNAPTPYDVKPTLRVDRRADVGSGNSGDTHKALWVYATSGPNNAGYEWALTTELHNRALGSLGAENVALNATAFKESNGVGPVGKTWGGNIVAHDKTGEVNPLYGLIGLEVNAFAESGGTDSHRQRVGLHLALCGFSGTHVGYGLLIGAKSGAFIDRAIAFQGASEGAGSFAYGIDMTDATFSSNAALMMRETHRVALDGVYSGAFNRSLRYEAGRLRYSVVGADVFSVADDGVAYLKGFNLQSPTVAASAAAGSSGALPAQVAGYLSIASTLGTIKVPYFN